MTAPTRPYTLWAVTHPELFVRIEVPARSHQETQRVAWQQWYRRPVRTGLDELMRDAFKTENTRKPAEGEVAPSSRKANTSGP